jgi:uncharacterized protein (TIGR02757 family)
MASELDLLYSKYNRLEFLTSDPLEFPRRYSDPLEVEFVALVSALLAYGNVRQIRASVESALRLMTEAFGSPKIFVEKSNTPRALEAFRGYRHRFNSGEDVVSLAQVVHRSWKMYGSIGGHFITHLHPQAPDITHALSGLTTDYANWAGLRMKTSFGYFINNPGNGSACKRWCMFLRWMGRHDALDLGLWTKESPLAKDWPHGLIASQLVLPIDTHTGRIGRYIGLTKRATLGWTAAVEMTTALKAFDQSDPVKYDFALARLGILDQCQRKYNSEICDRCLLLNLCQYARQKRRKKP